MTEISLNVEVGDQPAYLGLNLSEIDGPQIMGTISLCIPGLAWEGHGPCAFVTTSILGFAEAIRGLYQNLAGEARLLSFDEESEIVLWALDRRHGTIGVRVKVHWLLMPSHLSPAFPTIVLGFDELTTNQTYLIPFATALESAVAASGATLDDPWGSGDSIQNS